jgi:hypothetical protein
MASIPAPAADPAAATADFVPAAGVNLSRRQRRLTAQPRDCPAATT